MVAKLHGSFVARIPGFEVVGAVHSGKDAIRACRDLLPDLVLLDVYLPDMTGLEVLARLRRDAPQVDVLVITAAREADTVRQELRSGVVHYLIKPFTFDDLRERLDHYAGAHRGLDGRSEADQAGVDRIFGMVPVGRRVRADRRRLAGQRAAVSRVLRLRSPGRRRPPDRPPRALA